MSSPYRETKFADWFTARRRGERLPAHELSCTLCGERSEEAVCLTCIEIQLEALSYERSCEAH